MLVAFDMFGTLADTSSVADELEAWCGDHARGVAKTWRTKQLEYMFRVTAMGQFPTFTELTTWGLLRALSEFRIAVPAQAQLTELVDGYRRLKPFDDVRSSLAALHAQGHRVVVLSVGPRSWLEELIASYESLVDDLISAEDAGVYKPHPGIYHYLLKRTGAESASTVLVSSNPFDIIGADAAGLRTIWCKRDPAEIFDPWGGRPDHIVETLTFLAEVLAAR